MRLIDADALFEVIKKSMAENPHKEKTQRAMHIHEHKYFLTLLTTFPTIQPEERTEKRTETHGVCLDVIRRQAAKLKVARVVWEKGDTAEDFNDKCVDCLDDVQPEEAIPVSWIEAKIELVNSLPGVSMLKMKTADWRDLVEQWKAEQRSPEVDHDAQIREFAEEMSKHGVK